MAPRLFFCRCWGIGFGVRRDARRFVTCSVLNSGVLTFALRVSHDLRRIEYVTTCNHKRSKWNRLICTPPYCCATQGGPRKEKKNVCLVRVTAYDRALMHFSGIFNNTTCITNRNCLVRFIARSFPYKPIHINPSPLTHMGVVPRKQCLVQLP